MIIMCTYNILQTFITTKIINFEGCQQKKYSFNDYYETLNQNMLFWLSDSDDNIFEEFNNQLS